MPCSRIRKGLSLAGSSASTLLSGLSSTLSSSRNKPGTGSKRSSIFSASLAALRPAAVSTGSILSTRNPLRIHSPMPRLGGPNGSSRTMVSSSLSASPPRTCTPGKSLRNCSTDNHKRRPPSNSSSSTSSSATSFRTTFSAAARAVSRRISARTCVVNTLSLPIVGASESMRSPGILRVVMVLAPACGISR